MYFPFSNPRSRGALFFFIVTLGAFSQSCVLTSSWDANTRPQRGQRNRSLCCTHSQQTTLPSASSRSETPPLSSFEEREWDTALHDEASRPLYPLGLDNNKSKDGPSPIWLRWDSSWQRCEPCWCEPRVSFCLCIRDVCFYPHALSNDKTRDMRTNFWQTHLDVVL